MEPARRASVLSNRKQRFANHIRPSPSEASIYHATTFDADGQELAIKVYKTSVVVLKYVQGTLFWLDIEFNLQLMSPDNEFSLLAVLNYSYVHSDYCCRYG
ncbi:uncharacterized protein LOC133876490 [Alnus glutinosa]|uniref:uncharacterized protein LOC133876490 n=1 Tax=Alnus glutinosa TaxID=3517 RepID=UPI002D765AF5|nr:uncharacterized protein LOC133876490 [Alnus glutinosa]